MEAQQTPGGGPPPAPGWYPDPSQPGAQRWWDGTGWTQQTQGPQQGYTPQAYGAYPHDADRDARQWAMFAHLSAILAGFIGPLIIWLVKRDDHPFVADQGREALNFNLSVLIYTIVLSVAFFVLAVVTFGIGGFLFFLLAPLYIGVLVLQIIAGVKANGGEAYRYPLTIRMVG